MFLFYSQNICKHGLRFYLLVRLVEKSTLEQLPVHQDRQNGWGKETLLHSFLADTLTLFEEACSRGIVSTSIPMYRDTTINFSQPNPIVEGKVLLLQPPNLGKTAVLSVLPRYLGVLIRQYKNSKINDL